MASAADNGFSRWFVVSGSSGVIDATGIPFSDALAMLLSKASPTTVTLRIGLNTEKQARCQQN